jgi:hypothetical protein
MPNKKKRSINSLSHYTFKTEDAEKYGIEEAILLYHFRYWSAANASNGSNFHDGKNWCYNTYEELAQFFPFFKNVKKVERLVKSLKEQGAILVGNFNKLPYDRTNWYTINEGIDADTSGGLQPDSFGGIDADTSGGLQPDSFGGLDADKPVGPIPTNSYKLATNSSLPTLSLASASERSGARRAEFLESEDEGDEFSDFDPEKADYNKGYEYTPYFEQLRVVHAPAEHASRHPRFG